ncbi:hypothetical protein [Mesobacillus maritimus]|uniref:Uncharacterized protein n=1 Tax=Mesobacillus maritimus TaxID=1643336 RepID=A0ABS7K7M1_9BACI|nr:hypothetical protein [Mesobacillus maritimus]MBY0098090.1 hypothetical protein [Mesobacillus maritimus]
MKRLSLLLSTLFFLGILSSCTNETGTPILPTENNMIIHINNKADFEFYGLELAVLHHSQGSVNADGSKIGKDENLTFEFRKEDFELEGSANMEVFILTKHNGERIPLSKKVTLELHPNQVVSFELTGESMREAELKRVN